VLGANSLRYVAYPAFLIFHTLFILSATGIIGDIAHIFNKNVANDCCVAIESHSTTVFFFEENVRYLICSCSETISLILGTRFSLILGTGFLILGTRTGYLKHLKKPCSALLQTV